jgi:hypothetical protein
MPTPPIVLIAFNRPDLVAHTFARIREAKPAELFLVCDGPRDGHPTDAQRCAEVRRFLDESVDWPCEVHRKYFADNGGCDRTIELGLDWVFEHVTRAVVLEDDCVADPSFFEFCDELLDRYADDDRVAQIAGSTLFVEPRFFGANSYDFVPYAAVWGWATWRRAWQAHRAVFPRLHGADGTDDSTPVRHGAIELGDLATAGGRRYFAEVARDRDPHGFNWDSQWWVSTVCRHQLCITPKVNMVENVGFGADATHTRSTRVMPKAEAVPFPLTHPAAVRANPEIARETEHVLVRGNGRLARQMRRLIPQGPLRTFARTLATGPAAVWVMRTASQLVARARRLLHR